MSQKGYIRLHRRLMSNWLWPKDRPYTEAEAWIWLLLFAAHSPHKQRSDRRLIFVDVGELLASISDLARTWGWGRRRVANFLQTLEKEHMIRTSNGTRYDSRLKIIHYADYQEKNDAGCTANESDGGTDDDADDDSASAQMASLKPAQRAGKEPPLNNGNKGKEDIDPGTDSDSIFCWTDGVGFLMTKGETEKRTRAFIGKAIKDHGAGAVAQAIRSMLRRLDTVEKPIPYLLAILKGDAGKTTGNTLDRIPSAQDGRDPNEPRGCK